MTHPDSSLPDCRWRHILAGQQYQCRSPKYLLAPNTVSAETCRGCGFVDHEPPAPQRRALPCVHLGAWTGKSVKMRGGARHDLFACALHEHCVADATEPGAARICTDCEDYLPRDPSSPNSDEMRRRAEAFLADLADYPAERYRGRGIVIAGGGDRYFASLYVTIRAIRHVGCTLPIQVWYLGRNKEMPPARRALLKPLQVECVDADKVRRTHPARQLDGWELKVFATLHSPFEEVLFLDADCYPCRNPAFLFDLEEYRAKGAIFWPDWLVKDERLKWAAFGLDDPHYPGTIESGQFVVNKRTCWRPLNLAWFYNDHSDYYYCYGYGDKHTFEAAWTSERQPFVMFIPKARIDLAGYVHVGPDREPLFVHRCSDKFRLDTQVYPTAQRNVLPAYYPETPLEAECWGWLTELARALDVPFWFPRDSVARPVRAPARNVTVATLYTPEVAAYGELSAQVVRQYARRHGHRAVIHTEVIDAARPPAWSKILLVERIFKTDPRCAWVMWIDADAVILRHDVALTRFLDDTADFIVAENTPQCALNTGVFFVRNCRAVKQMLRQSYRKTHLIHHPWWENQAIVETIQEGVPGLRVKTVPRRLFNSYAAEYQDGDFAIHFAGHPSSARIEGIRRFAAPILSSAEIRGK